VLVALGRGERGDVSWLVSALAHLPIQLCVVPDVATEAARAAVEVVDGLPVLGLTESAIAGWAARAKRALDLALALPALTLLAPLLLAIAAAIRLDTPGPALFRQERVGQHNRRFTILKFRTMYVDAEARARAVAVHTSEGLVHKRRDDPRVTRVGAWLRRTSLDELPQLVNVVLGDMSLVGPRPELPWLVERYHAWQYRRLLVPQGITGWWQVHGRSDRVLHLHTQDDLYYVRNASLALDLKILLLTIKVVLTGKGAF
jgi:exopolysaccharide biosynthesis polyprenyl glycosylphosphotransferase